MFSPQFRPSQISRLLMFIYWLLFSPQNLSQDIWLFPGLGNGVRKCLNSTISPTHLTFWLHGLKFMSLVPNKMWFLTLKKIQLLAYHSSFQFSLWLEPLRCFVLFSFVLIWSRIELKYTFKITFIIFCPGFLAVL